MNIWPVSYSEIPENLREESTKNSLFATGAFAKLWRSTGGRDLFWLVEERGEGLMFLPALRTSLF